MEEEFDRLTRLAAKLLKAPATFFSLVDEERDFYKSCFGFPEPLASERELEGTTFCHYAIVSDGGLVIPDTRADPIYSQVPTVESMGVAAYLGIPIHAPNGEVLGSFCAIDFVPRPWSAVEVETMKELATSAEREVAIRDWMRRQSKLMEREQESRRDLEAVMESRSRLMRGFTHDVRNPLGAADGFLALLEDGVYGPLDEKPLATVVRTRRIIGNAVDLINDLLELARAETQDIEISSELVDVGAIVPEATEEYRPQASAKVLSLICEVASDLPVIASDEHRIRQIVGNLLSNAIKYTESGSVSVQVDRQPRKEGGDLPLAIFVHVNDTGPGIAESKQQVVFREFARLDSKGIEGMGLGLAISQRIANALGGEITLDSRVGVGTTFTLGLPESAPPLLPD